MASLYSLLSACQADHDALVGQAQQSLLLWEKWLQPVSAEGATGDDPGYDDDFQQIREEVNKLSGADTELVCTLTEKLLTGTAKDIRIATYYAWARLHRDGENGLADGLELLAGLMQRFNAQLHPQRDRSRKAALAWLGSQRMLDSLSLYPEASSVDTRRIAGALALMEKVAEGTVPAGLYNALETRLMSSGGPDVVVPQNVSAAAQPSASSTTPELSAITSGQELLSQARILAKYLSSQPDGWLSAHHLMKSIRHDTLQQLPPLSVDGRTRIEPPKPDQRALLKRLYVQQNWQELQEQADEMFSRGANHLWLDVQWYIHQALLKSGHDALAAIIQNDLKGLLTRLMGLEGLAFNDGTPFADEVTLNWIQQQVMDDNSGWREEQTRIATDDNEILQLEAEALAIADSEGADAAMSWLQNRPGIHSARNRWLIRLLMSRIAEQTGKNELAHHLLAELGAQAAVLPLTEWEPELTFEVNARHLRLLRMKAGRNESDKARLQPEMDRLLAELIALDPARAAVLCG